VKKTNSSESFDPEPMKIIGKDGQIKTVIIGTDVTELNRLHVHVIDYEQHPVCLICKRELSEEEVNDAMYML